MTENLFKPFALNNTITLKNRILMAPLTRCMADENLVPTTLMATYYAKRAAAGLIISEAVIIRPDGQGYPNTPGLFTPEQITGWRKVTDAVHSNGGKIFAQLWHTGRVAHPYFYGCGNDNAPVLAPSAVAVKGSVPRMRQLTYKQPKEATIQEISSLIEDYGKAANNAIKAGFDGIELHGANGYLIDQFLHHDSNRRSDKYGGVNENMVRFPLNVVDEVIHNIGADRTGLRISPGAYFNITSDHRDREVFDHFLPELEKRNLAYLHIGIFDDSMEFDYLGGSVSSYVRANYNNTLVGVGGYTAQTASNAIDEDKFDLIAIGRPFIANPDYVSKIRNNVPLIPYSDDMLTSLE